MARIFINYRRDDTQGVAGRLFDHLITKFSRRELFMDVDTMQPGVDFTKQLDTQVAQCHVLLAMIGPHWLEAHDQAGRMRLDNAKDSVRIELASALKRDIAVIPVLVDGAVMPAEDKLPDDLKPLARRHALELRHTRFYADADAIAHALEAVVPPRRSPWILAGSAVAAAAVIAAVVFGLSVRSRAPSAPPAPTAPSAPAIAMAPAAAVHPPAPLAPPAPQAAQPAVPTTPNTSTAPNPPARQAAVPAPANSAAAFGLPAGVKLGDMLTGIALPGSILRVTDISADPAVCQAACRAEARCAAWTYTQPSVANPAAHCSLKTVIPGQVSDVCCTSGIEREPPPEMREPPAVPPSVVGVQRGIELEGGTYHYFGGSDATPEGCQSACRADTQCVAWDYMRPGVSSPDARCFLKNRVSRPVASPCCIAGFERTESK